MAHQARWHTAAGGHSVLGAETEDYARTIDKVILPETVSEYADRYEAVIGDRERFLWKWFHNLSDEFALSSIAPDVEAIAKEQKTLLTMFITTLDDLAERDSRMGTFERARHVPFQERIPDPGPETDRAILAFIEDLWETIEAEIEDAARYGEFAEVFRYDLRQTINSMDYSRVLNRTASMANRTESERFDAYNMSMFPYADVDLMHSPSFRIQELGALRSLLCELQQMARIGNWITTWKRELAEADFSSGIVVCAIRRGVVTPAELRNSGGESVERLIDRICSHGIESEFTREWRIRHKAVRKRTGELNSIEEESLIDGLEAVMGHHLSSNGYK